MKVEIKRSDSSNIQAMAYDVQSRSLAIRFHSGGVYIYREVEPQTFCGIAFAESAGKAFHRLIKGKYSVEKYLPEQKKTVLIDT